MQHGADAFALVVVEDDGGTQEVRPTSVTAAQIGAVAEPAADPYSVAPRSTAAGSAGLRDGYSTTPKAAALRWRAWDCWANSPSQAEEGGTSHPAGTEETKKGCSAHAVPDYTRV